MKKYFYIFIIITAILGIANIAKAQECATPSYMPCTEDCKSSNPNYSTDGTAGAAYYACYKTCVNDNALREKIYQDCLYQLPVSVTPENTPALIKYFVAGDIKKGDTITAPIDKKVNIVISGQKIDLMEGSVIKYVDAYTWQMVNGVAHFVEKLDKIASQGRHKVIAPNAVCAVRGTQFTVDAAVDGQTVITVIKGVVNVAPTAKGKKAVDVKEGYQLAVGNNGALAKPVKFDAAALDAWYETVPADVNFLNSSWSKEAVVNRYRRGCDYTAGAATPTQTLTADEQKVVEAVNQGLAVYRVKTSDTVMEKDKRALSAKEKTTLNGTVAAQFFFDPKGIYYPSDKAGTYKTYQDKTLINNLFKMVREKNMAYGFDQSTFTFTNWEGTGKNRLAVYSGKLDSDGTNEFISSATGQNQEAGQPVGAAKIYIDEESQLWDKAELTINVQSGKVMFPLSGDCRATYGDAVKITLPAKVKKVNAKTGFAELQQALGKVR